MRVFWHLLSWNWSTIHSTINVLVPLRIGILVNIQYSISQGPLKTDFGEHNQLISAPNVSKYAY